METPSLHQLYQESPQKSSQLQIFVGTLEKCFFKKKDFNKNREVVLYLQGTLLKIKGKHELKHRFFSLATHSLDFFACWITNCNKTY